MPNIREAVQAADDTQSEPVVVPEWNGVSIEVRGMSGLDRAAYVTAIVAARESEDPADYARVQAELIIATSHDPEDGSKVFQDGDADWLINKSGAALERLSAAAMRTSGLDANAEERLGKPSSASADQTDVDPSASTPSDGSTSPSPSN